VCWLLFTDPQIYRVAHASHHRYIHTVEDLEFFCEDWSTERKKRRRQFYAELILGSVAWQVATYERLRKAGRVSIGAATTSLGPRIGLVLVWFVPLWLIAPELWGYALVSWLGTLWLGALLTRHNQWIEHLGILAEGDIIERNALSRNLVTTGLAERMFNFYAHADPAEHVYHHTDGRLSTRNLGFGLPADANSITLGGYFKVLRDYARSL
jgi:hypothetical protein